MAGYVFNFVIYALAMVGLIILAVVTYQKTLGTASSNRDALSIDEKLSLNPRKTLYIVKAGKEKFLIASDLDRTSLIAKLDDNKPKIAKKIDFEPEREEVSKPSGEKIAVMKSLAKKLSAY